MRVYDREQVRNSATEDVFPRHLLLKCHKVLILFAAGFYGANDGYWVARAKKRARCVDRDGAKLRTMQWLYPSDWQFEEADVFEFIDQDEALYDLVILDPPLNLSTKCFDALPVWLSRARVGVVQMVSAQTLFELNLSDPGALNHYLEQFEWFEGWQVSLVKRMPESYWMVVERR